MKELVVCGAGIQVGHLTTETTAHIRSAEKVLYLVADPLTESKILKLNVRAESLARFYSDGKPRIESYREMIEFMLGCLAHANYLVVVFYGHPGVFVYPSHEVIRVARDRGVYARMLPAVSAEDCLFADLGIDPCRFGLQTFEATDFLVYQRTVDTRSALILWQVGVVGDTSFSSSLKRAKGIGLLTERLEEFYALDQPLYLYEAAQYVISEPRIQRTTLAQFGNAVLTPITTAYFPPARESIADQQLVTELNIPSISSTERSHVIPNLAMHR